MSRYDSGVFRARVLGSLVLVLVFNQCARKSDEVRNATPSIASPTAPSQDGWISRDRDSPDGSVKLIRSEMSPGQKERVKQEYRQTTMTAVPAEARFNVSLFKIDNVPEWASTVFIAPRLFAYGSAQGGRVAPERHPDGTVSLSFPVALIDGTRNTIDSPSGSTQITVPQSLLVTDLAELKADLQGRLGKNVVLSPLPGCPKRLLLKVNDREIDVTPSDLEHADYCQPNKPFNVTARLAQEDARYLLEEALYANAVEIRADFETRVSFVSSKATVRFDKGQIFRDIEAEISASYGAWADADAHVKVTDIIKSRALSIELQGDVAPIVQNVVDQAIKELFLPFVPGPDTKTAACTGTMVCLRLNYNYSKESDSFEFKWVQTSTALTGQNYLTWTGLAPLLDKEVLIGGGINTGGEPRPELSSNIPAGIETGLTVLAGDLLEITPAYLIEESRQFDIPRTETVHHPVCLQSQPAQTHDVCRRACHRENGCELECHPETKPAQCLKSEDQWIATTTYSRSAPEYLKIDQPIGQMEKIFDGLALRFVWRTPLEETEREITCPLNQFSRSGDGIRLIVRLENRGSCKMFLGDPSVQPMLYLVNRIDYPVSYKEGSEVRLWNGENPRNPSERIYHPEVKFAGRIAIRGYSFGSVVSGGQREL